MGNPAHLATGVFAGDEPDLEWGGLTPHLAALLQVCRDDVDRPVLLRLQCMSGA